MKKKNILKVVLVAFLVAFISCNKAAESKNDEEDNENEKKEDAAEMAIAKTAIEKQGALFVMALNKGDSVGVANCYTKDAKMMQPNGKSIEGRENIQKTISAWMKAGMPTFAMKTVGVWGDDDQLTAEEEWTFTDKDGKVVDSGKSLEVFIKEDGNWKMYRDCYNSDMPPPPAK